jgi:hypothetical protein
VEVVANVESIYLILYPTSELWCLWIVPPPPPQTPLPLTSS